MSTDAARFVGSIPENYDAGLGPHIFSGYAADLAARVASTHPASVLELAAGTGIVTRALRDALGPDCELTASDLNPPMLEVARSKFDAESGVHFEVIDATAISRDDASFDVVACQFGVMFFPDKAKSYAEVHRVLKPGGTYWFNVWGSLEENEFAQVAHRALGHFFPSDPPGFFKVPFGYNDEAEIRKALEAGGFRDIVIETVPLVAKIQSAEGFARGLVLGNPSYEEIVSRGVEPEAVVTYMTKTIDAELGNEMDLSAKLVRAQK